MKKKSLHMLFLIAALALAAGFCISAAADAMAYDPAADSAPFSAFLLVRALEFLLPGLISLCAAAVLRKKFNRSSGRRK